MAPFLQLSLLSLSASLVLITAQPGVPLVELKNSCAPGQTMPAIGLGTGAYSGDATVGYGNYPECWSSTTGCGAYVQTAVKLWLSLGGRRIDNANSYQNQIDVGIGIAQSGIPRSEIFLLSKVGPSHPLGYNDTLTQFAGVLSDMNVTYVDMLLVHWPWDSASQGNVSHNTTQQSTDPFCNHTSPMYEGKECRLSTWRAMVVIWQSGQAKAIGVSNYNVSHFQEIADAGLPLPSLTQNPFHLYRSSTQMDVLSYTQRNGITFMGYSPFGVPDYYVYPSPPLPVANQLTHPAVVAMAKLRNVTAAQILIAWMWELGIPVNPRSMSQAHMIENMQAYVQVTNTMPLNQTEMDLLNSQPQVACAIDSYYECAP